jgi:small subunit ribosomal protein S9
MAGKVVNVAGKRKEAIARASIKDGSGLIRINSRLFEALPYKYAKMRILESLDVARGFVDLSKLDISVKSEGGGFMGQAEAVACAIARGLVQFTGSDELLAKYHDYDRTLLAGDSRQTEVHKPGQSSKGPRHKRQKSYR